jgi:hypothetical protein
MRLTQYPSGCFFFCLGIKLYSNKGSRNFLKFAWVDFLLAAPKTVLQKTEESLGASIYEGLRVIGDFKKQTPEESDSIGISRHRSLKTMILLASTAFPIF